MKSVPFRTCLGCKKKKPQDTLWRFGADKNGRIVWDDTNTMPGRGAYSCRSYECYIFFCKNKNRLSAALRREITGCDQTMPGHDD
ncbi:MAG: YlxR family protein [Proteobacteria bacterium]|nr:YlxR family protein [Pseudomonadota bacterium]MBU1711215.1 YlxR family protein [Pseudomonadota bacterium]